ncbi:MAG: hypothetical protein M9904_05465 [Chitinophagaceae bacterium]|nr:hypothetical protein [Chitinophagaceae bacterium]
MNNKEIKELIEVVKRELSLYIKLSDKLQFPENEIEKQVNKYLETLHTLQELLKNHD